MKKFVACLLMITLAFGIAGCNSSDIPEETTQISQESAAASMTADEWIDFIADKVPFDDTMTKVGAEQAKAVYGIYEEDGYTGDCALYISTMATPEEVAVFTADDTLTLDDLYKKIEDRLSLQKESYADYAPQEVPKLESAVIKIVGDKIIVVVSADNALVSEIIK